MNLIIIGLIIGAFFGVLFGYDKDATAPFTIFGLLMGGLGGAIIGMIAGPLFLQYEPIETKTPIELLNDGSTVRTVIKGFAQGEDVFRFYVRNSNGALELRSVPAKTSSVYDNTETEAYLMTYCQQLIDNDWVLEFEYDIKNCRFEFHVPAGSMGSDPEITLDGG